MKNLRVPLDGKKNDAMSVLRPQCLVVGLSNGNECEYSDSAQKVTQSILYLTPCALEAITGCVVRKALAETTVVDSKAYWNWNCELN